VDQYGTGMAEMGAAMTRFASFAPNLALGFRAAPSFLGQMTCDGSMEARPPLPLLNDLNHHIFLPIYPNNPETELCSLGFP
jgi:hypothetical protein